MSKLPQKIGREMKINALTDITFFWMYEILWTRQNYWNIIKYKSNCWLCTFPFYIQAVIQKKKTRTQYFKHSNVGYINHLLHIAFTHKLSANSKDDIDSLFIINYCCVVKMPVGCRSYTTAMPVCFFLNGATFVGMMCFWVEQHRGRCGLDCENSLFYYRLLFAVIYRL